MNTLFMVSMVGVMYPATVAGLLAWMPFIYLLPPPVEEEEEEKSEAEE
jgi:ABC-type uncharacterized transport system permease subunit